MNGLVDNPFSATSESLMTFFDEEALRGGGAIDFLASNNLALAREAFVRIGGFRHPPTPLAAGEETATSAAAGFAAGFRSRARSRGRPSSIFHALDLAGFWRQHTHYGRGAARFHAAHGTHHDGADDGDPRRLTRPDGNDDSPAGNGNGNGDAGDVDRLVEPRREHRQKHRHGGIGEADGSDETVGDERRPGDARSGPPIERHDAGLPRAAAAPSADVAPAVVPRRDG